MPGIKHLQDIYEKKGAAETRKFISGNVQITEKLDAHRFSFQIDKNRNVIFYKKNDNRELTKVDRLISDLYEKAISHIESLPKNVIKSIPEGLRFGFSYFPNNKPLRIDYKFKPENRLVLTDVTHRNEKGKVKKVYENVDYLNRWADILEVSKPPILFSGKLSEDQKNMILNIALGNQKTNAFFTNHIESIFESTYTKNNIIEGIVIRTNEGLSQLRDPSYKIFFQANKPVESRDFYDLTIVQITEFMKKFQFPMLESIHDPEERYIELISSAYNKFINEGIIDKDFDYQYLQPNIIGEFGSLGKKFIKNPETIRLVNESKLNRELFKVFVSTHRKHRKPYGLLTQSVINEFNQIVDKIKECSNSELHTYESFQRLYEETDYDEGANINDNELDSEPIKVISSLQVSFNHKSKKEEPQGTKVKILLIDSHPINLNHKNIISELGEDGGKIILVNVKRSYLGNSEKTYYLSDVLMDKMMTRIANDYSEVIGFLSIDYAGIADIFKSSRKSKYEPIQLIVPSGSGANYMSQLYLHEEILGKRLNTLKEFDIREYKNEKYYQSALRGIEDGNYKLFKDATPEAIHGFWDILLTDYRQWAGLYPEEVKQK